MRRIKCKECGKLYNYDEDAFCSHCGAFNQIQHTVRVGADGTIVRRRDGLNEANHSGSFVHQELHTEDRTRRRAGLEQTAGTKHARTKAQPDRQDNRGKKIWLFVIAIIVISVLPSLLGLIQRIYWMLYYRSIFG